MDKEKMKVFITGSAGFIGMHLASMFIKEGHEVVSIDSLLSSYGGNLPRKRSEYLLREFNHKIRIADINLLDESDLLNFIGASDLLIHLAAWPGVRQGQALPSKYSLNNIVAFSRIIAAVHSLQLPKFFFASSSSIYGDLGLDGPVKETDATGTNLKSHYAVNKWMNELEAKSYGDLGSTSIVALRFFTAYGPWGRPDMAYWTFLEKIFRGEVIELYGENGGWRNFTFIADLVNIVHQLSQTDMKKNYQALNIACGSPIETVEMLSLIHKISGIKDLKINQVDRPSVDVEKTWANLESLKSIIALPTPTSMETGLGSFFDWFIKNKEKS
jgi:UDP-glucuronate 4-epimerase